MINRDSRGHSYFIVRGEILGFMKDPMLHYRIIEVMDIGIIPITKLVMCIFKQGWIKLNRAIGSCS